MELPRDIQLLIVQRMDIDTRRTLGIIWKLRIPRAFREDATREQETFWSGSRRWQIFNFMLLLQHQV